MKARTLDAISELLKKEPFYVEEPLTPKTEIRKVKSWDSLKHLSLLIEVEEQFKIKLETEDILKIVTVGDLVELIER